jgi:translocation and assembly module TamA
VNFNAAFSTDLGGTLGASWVDRDLFGNAEQLTLSASATELGGSAAKQPGYNVSATLAFPDWETRDQTLTLNVTALKEYLEAYDRTAYLAGATVARKISPNLTLNVGLTGEQAKITQESVTRDYTLAQIPLGAVFDNTGSLFDPTHGTKLSATVTPTESIRKPSGTFVITQLTASTYLNLEDPGRGVLALRALVGGVEGATTFDIPPDQRFYAGGSGTVRGYKYQSVGPRFPDNNPVGGTSIDAVNVEFRQRFGETYGAVVFADAGQVGTGGTPFSGQMRVGAGLGARYYTSLGPIRLDIAVPLNKRKGDDALEAYIGLGQAF